MVVLGDGVGLLLQNHFRVPVCHVCCPHEYFPLDTKMMVALSSERGDYESYYKRIIDAHRL